LLLLALLMNTAAGAGTADKFFSGKELLDHCVIAGQRAVMPWGVKITTEDASAIVCHAYLGAVNDAHNFHSNAGHGKRQYCIPPQVTLEDFAVLLLDYARVHPPGGQDAGQYVLGAYVKTFPCQ
jgi:hypothetical protein